MIKNHFPKVKLKYAIGLTCALIAVALGASLAQAAPANLPPRPTAEPTPIAQPASSAPGALIRLGIEHPRWEIWTVVQWQDALGGWHDVEGWKGTMDEIEDGQGIKTWWVARSDFSKGPFRWVIYSGPTGKLMTSSEAFHLPRVENTMLTVPASLK